ncbi:MULTISPECIES: aspartate aminotransferase family protein [unclassified Ruegeria]|uniref:aspartate aminotransferase family protein n=1 Tax=unclassified Ruegeria TaxID=2625375 RepID=UPI001488CD46|nr:MULTISPECIES: aspartate aminotransferase family protein [unclassified Ruegeria]NOD75251.1 aspartate aminotransferase family protein [Ruegeria sp. HKCCD4332]NOD87212.1 aspartate aminotransferase family protein [Ruegeria sp. HKCCD4318]NOE12767.1 aspartate aminotransferase family protein [Ruegeria sp. HKCCD4318-2]NOG09067.1 aspartate aminotransferase family protein [Ruegeria sp. HKCCD4315]
MSHVFPRHTKSDLPIAAGGDGCYLIDAQGKRYLDCGDAAVSCLGHSNPAVIRAVQEQVEQIAFAHSGFMTSEPAEALADLLIQHAPGDLDRVYFVSGGSEATEAAIKLARQYFLEIGQPERRHVIARKQSYHGNTLGALSAGGNAWRRAQFAPMLIEMTHISACYEYAEKPEGESSFDYGQRVANELEVEILRLGPETVMAFMAEPVVGATLGAVPAVEGYFKRIREICDQYGVLLILDEVMCGMGRTGHLFACDHDGIEPDILCIAKGLGAGYQPIGAMLCTGAIYDAIRDGSGFFQHGHTYIGHPVATAAALAVVRELTDRDLPARAGVMGDKVHSALEAAFGQHANVGDLRGRGLFRGIELVSDRGTKAPFDPSLGIAGKVKKAAMAEGLICYPMAGTRDGRNGDHILLAPPFIIEDAQIDELVGKLRRALNAVI